MLSASEPAVSSAPAATPMLIELSSQVCASGPALSAEARVGMLVSGPQNVANARNVPSDAIATEVDACGAGVAEVRGGDAGRQCVHQTNVQQSLLTRPFSFRGGSIDLPTARSLRG